MDNKNYYEEFDWEDMQSEHIHEKIRLFFDIIPQDVETILDVGCGNGIITNKLALRFNVTGVDRSKAALEFVKTRKLQCNCNDLPFSDQSFDLVISSELLEHLEDDVYQQTIAEIKRVAKEYILISVPNNEQIQRDLIKCPSCRYVYNMNYHQRSISLSGLSKAFDGFTATYTTVAGPKVKPSFKLLTNIKHSLSPSDSWIPAYWTKKRKRTTVCPMCNKTYEIPFKHHPVSFIYDVITWLFSKSKHYWLIALFEKTGTGK